MENPFTTFEENQTWFDSSVSFLVVDDDARARESLSTLLGRQWSDITEAEDGEIAIALIAQRQFKIIILDLKTLPQINKPWRHIITLLLRAYSPLVCRLRYLLPVLVQTR